MQHRKKHKYTAITETPDTMGSREQIARLYARYRFAYEYCKDKEVLEAACGAGIGLGYLAGIAKKVVGGDVDEGNLKFARKTYDGRNNIEIRLLDAHNLPFSDGSFDVVILYEAIYYLSQPEKFLDEARRVLRNNGVLIICSSNKDWSGFNPSPYSCRYFSSMELYHLIKERKFEVELYADCPAYSDRLKDKIISATKQAAVKLRLIPGTMKGKEKLKRLFFGKLDALPPEISDDMADYSPPTPIPHDLPDNKHKVLIAVGRKE